jgi:hypothetical protein
MKILMTQNSKRVLADFIKGLEISEYCILSECCVIVLFSVLRINICYFYRLH